MENQIHCFIAQYFMENSQLRLENYCIKGATGYFKCDFSVGEEDNTVKINLQYIPGQNGGESWLTVRGDIGRMGEIYNLSRIAEFFNDFPVPLYTLMLDRRGRNLILGRVLAARNVNDSSMNDLTYGLVEMVRKIRRFMLPHNVPV